MIQYIKYTLIKTNKKEKTQKLVIGVKTGMPVFTQIDWGKCSAL
jgi:hypothetical protein